MKSRDAGFTLLELMVALAIFAVLLAIAVPDWIHTEQAAALSTAVDEVSAARLALERTAAEDTGATLSVTGTMITVTGNGYDEHWSGHLPHGFEVMVNGDVLSCLSLNGEEIPVVSAGCSVLPSGTQQIWSVERS
jgi:prepilin-type N-terminal cleavage/methylation domain-containing protein